MLNKSTANWQAGVLMIVVFVSATTYIKGEPPETVDEALARLQIEPTRASLVAALGDSNREARNLAAQKLAIMQDKSAIPLIENALAAEVDLGNRVTISGALILLGDDKGFSQLRNICDDTSAPGNARILAAQNLLILKNSGYCLKDVLALAEPGEDPNSRSAALSTLISYSKLPRASTEKTVSLAVQALQDPSPVVRLSAVEVLATVGTASEIQTLQGAITREEDPAVRSTMESGLARLRQRLK